MEYVIVALLWLGGIAAAILAHFLAHDLYSRCPGIADRVVRKAATRLPDELHSRYQEEWLAHLSDCEGAISKLQHALGCYLCAWQLRKLSLSQSLDFEINGRKISVDRPTAAFVLSRLVKIFEQSADGAERAASLRPLLDSLVEEEPDVLSNKRKNPKQLKLFAQLLKEEADLVEYAGRSRVEMSATDKRNN